MEFSLGGSLSRGRQGGIWEEAVAGGSDAAVARGSWWFGISALIHCYSPFQEMGMYRVVGTSSSEGVLQIIIRGD